MATSVTQPGTANVLQGTDALTIVLTVPSLPDGMLCILVTEAGFGGTVANIVDSAGHNYMANLHQSTDPVNNNFSAFSYVNNCQGYTGGKTITVTWTAPMHAYLRLFWYFQGDMVLDQWDVTHLSAPTGSFSGATLTPKYEGSLIFSYVASHQAAGDFAVSNLAIGSGFRTISGPSGTDAAEDLVQATIAPIAATWTSDVNSRNSVWTLVFRPYGWMQNNDPNNYIFSGTTTHYSFLNGPVSTGGTVVVFFGWNDATVDAPVLSDNATGATNSYTVLAPLVPGDAHVWYVAYCTNVRGRPTQITIVTQHNVTGAILTQMCELGGSWNFDSFDKKKSAAGNYALGTVTPARNGALIYGVSVMYNTQDALRVSGPFRRTFTAVIEPATMIQAAAALITPTYNSADTLGIASFVLAFDPSVQLPLAVGLAGNSNLTMAVTGTLPARAILQGISAQTSDVQQQQGQPIVPVAPVPSGVFSGGSQQVIAFKAQFPAFVSFNDADIASAFGLADVFTDPTQWTPAIYAKARMLWVANQLMVMRMVGAAPFPGALSGFMTPLGDLYVREIRFGERAVTMDQRRLFQNIAAGASVADAALSLTYFGLQYQTLRNRTFPAVMVV